MSRPTCAGSDTSRYCERAVVRYREGVGFCLFHPDTEPPVMDPKTGKPVNPTPLKAAVLPREPEPTPYRAPGRVVDPEPIAPAASYDDPTTPTQGDVPDHSTRQGEVSRQAAAHQAHDGADSHDVGPAECETTPASQEGDRGEQPAPVAPEPQPDPYVLTMQIAAEHCTRISTDPAIEHAVRCIAQLAVGALTALIAHTRPVEKPAPPASQPQPQRKTTARRARRTVDEAEAARRYTNGERLFDLAADLHIGVARLRTILQAQGVTIRARGEVIGRRGPEPRPFDVDEAQRLYHEGMDSTEVARHLGVKQLRVQQALRDRGILRRPLQQAAPLDEQRARHLYGTGLTLAQVAGELGVRVSRVADVLREHGELRPKGHQQQEQTA